MNKKILTIIFVILFNNFLNAQTIDFSRGVGIIGNWGSMEGITEIHDDYFDYLKRMNIKWVVIGNSLHVDNSVDSTVELRYTNDYVNYVPSWPDATLRKMIQQLHSNGYKVILACGIDEPWPEDGSVNPNIVPGKPAWRYQIGDPKTPAGYTLIQWPWNPTNTINQKFVSSFWKSYTDVAIYHAKLCQELGVEMFEVGAESQELFRTANIGTKYTVNYKTQIKALTDSVRNNYSGLIAYYMHIGTWQSAITGADTQRHNLWSDANFDIIGISLYDVIKPTNANYTTTTTVNTTSYFKNLLKTFFTTYVKKVKDRFPTKPIVALELGFQTRDITNSGTLVEPEGIISIDDKNLNGILDAEEIQANMFDAYFDISDSLGYPKGGVIFGDASESDATTSLSANFNGWGIRNREAERRLIKRFNNITFTSIQNRAPKLLTKTDSDYVAYIGDKFETKKFEASDDDASLGDILLYRTVWNNYPWFGTSSLHGKVVGVPQDDDFGWWSAKLFVQDIHGKPSIDTAKFKIWVIHKRNERITSTPPTSMKPGTAVSYQITAKDINGVAFDPTVLKYSILVNPGFLSVNTTGKVTGMPTYQIAGTRTAAEVKVTSPTGYVLYDSWPIQIENVNIAPLWENNRVIKIPNTTTQTFYYSPGYDTTIHKDSLITFRVVPASDMNSSDTLVYTYKIYDPNGTLVTSIVADKYNKADSIKYGARETKCVAISNIGTQLQVGILYEVRVSVSDGKVISNIPTPYPKFKVTGSNTQTASITVSKTQLSFGSVAINTSSTSQSINVSGTSLSANISITPPTGYEIRTGTNAFSTSAITLIQTSGTVIATNIDVRFSPTVAQQYNSTLQIKSTSAVDKNITVNGTGTATAMPNVTLSDTLIAFGNVTVGTNSQSQDFTVLGNSLLGSISILPPVGFEIRTGSNTFSSNAINLTPVNGSVSQTTIDLIFKATIQKDYFDTIKVSFTSSNEINNSSSAEEKFTSKKEINNLNANNFTTLGTSQKIIIVKGTGTVAANNPPTIISIAEATVIENTLYKYQVVATDPDTVTGDKLTYSFETKPSWLSISNTGLVSGTPIRKNVGDTIFTIKVTDLQGISVTQKTKLKIDYLNNAPIVISIADTIVTENNLYSYQLKVSDADSVFGDKHIFELTTSPSWLSITSLGLVSGIPTSKNIGDTVYAVLITDSKEAKVTQTVKLKVNAIYKAPIITLLETLLDFGITTVGTYSQTQSFSISGSNLVDTLKIIPPIYFEVKTDTLQFSSIPIMLIPSNGQVNSTTIDVRFKPNAQQSFVDSIKLKTKDLVQKNLIVKGAGTLTANNPPKITSIAGTTSNENSQYKYQVIAIDPDTATGDKLTYSLEVKPTWLAISITGLISGTPTRKNVGDTLFVVKILDLQGAIASQKTDLKIDYLNQTPIIKLIPDTTIIENSLFEYQIIVSDADSIFGDKIIYSSTNKPLWLTISSSGLLSGTPLKSNVGENVFTVNITDTKGATASQIVKLKIVYKNNPITIISISPTNGPVGTILTIAGTNFSNSIINNTVWFGGIKAAVLSATSQELKVKVPISAGFSFPVVLSNGSQAISSKAFNSTFLGTDVPYLSSNLGTDAVPVTTGNFPVKSLLADFNDDGKQELVVLNYGGGNGVSSLYIYPNNIPVKGKIEVSQFSSPIILTPGTNPNGIAIGDIDGDGKLDIAVSNFWSYNISIFRNIYTYGNLTASSFATKQDVLISSNGKPGDVALSDLNGDGMLDLIVTDFNSVAKFGVSVFKNISTPSNISFGYQINFPTGDNPKRIGVANANGDSKPDLFIVSENSLTSNITYLQNNSTLENISFVAKVEIPTGKNPRDIAFADFNNDGLTDFVVPNYEVDSLTVYQNNSTVNNTIFNSALKISAAFPYTSPSSVTTADINGDGWIDFVYGNSSYQSAPHYLNTKSGGNINSTSFTKGYYNLTFLNNPTSVTLGDLNSDGKPELIVTASASDKVGIFRNRIGSSLSISQKIISSFGNVLIGSSKSAAVTITNTGDDTLKITKWVSLVDNFKVKELGSGAFILPSASHTDSIWFTPLTIGAKKGKILIETNGGFDTIYVEGIGTGKAILSLSTNNLDFGKVKINDSKKLSVKLKNSGNDTLFIKNFSLFGSTEFSFPQPPATGTFMAPSKEYDLEVTALPTNLGLRSAMLKINHNVGMDSVKFIMIGFGEPKIKLSVSKIDFGSVKQHLTKDSTLTIQNIGNDTLHIAKMELTNSQFTFGTTSTIRSIAPNNKSDEKISFKPLQNLGSVIGKLFITSNNLNVVTKDSVELVANVVTKVPIGVEIPTVYSLSQNYPNPFNPATTIKFGLPNESYVKLEIYNSLGQLVNTLIDEKLSARFYEIKWEAGNLPTGMYFYKIVAVDLIDQNNKLIQTRKMILMK